MKNSNLTFNELYENFPYIQVWWNGKKVYNDYDGDASIEDLHKFEEKYGNKIVYSTYIEVKEFHHVIIEVEGEE